MNLEAIGGPDPWRQIAGTLCRLFGAYTTKAIISVASHDGQRPGLTIWRCAFTQQLAIKAPFFSFDEVLGKLPSVQSKPYTISHRCYQSLPFLRDRA